MTRKGLRLVVAEWGVGEVYNTTAAVWCAGLLHICKEWYTGSFSL